MKENIEYDSTNLFGVSQCNSDNIESPVFAVTADDTPDYSNILSEKYPFTCIIRKYKDIISGVISLDLLKDCFLDFSKLLPVYDILQDLKGFLFRDLTEKPQDTEYTSLLQDFITQPSPHKLTMSAESIFSQNTIEVYSVEHTESVYHPRLDILAHRSKYPRCDLVYFESHPSLSKLILGVHTLDSVREFLHSKNTLYTYLEDTNFYKSCLNKNNDPTRYILDHYYDFLHIACKWDAVFPCTLLYDWHHRDYWIHLPEEAGVPAKGTLELVAVDLNSVIRTSKCIGRRSREFVITDRLFNSHGKHIHEVDIEFISGTEDDVVDEVSGDYLYTKDRYDCDD